MAKSFVQFLTQKITISVLITVVVFNVFSPVADNLFEPLIGYIIDQNGHLDNSIIELNENYEIKYGMVIKKFIVAIIVLALIYYVDRFFF
jgi:large-conductance mechanosensitive channel